MSLEGANDDGFKLHNPVKSSIVNGFVKDNGEDCGKEEASLLVAVNGVKVSRKRIKTAKAGI